jgi:outer membrane protein OmpA-like peptidoglycan-associated protein
VNPLNAGEKLCTNAEQVKEALYAVHERHTILEKKIYPLQRKEPVRVQLPKTVLQKIDTLLIPDVFFAVDKFNLNKRATEVLDSFIKSHAQINIDSIIVEGHTDNTGSIEHNEQLSKNRAATVAAYLQGRFSSSIISRGFASERPVADNRTSSGRQKNRRVEIYLYIRE